MPSGTYKRIKPSYKPTKEIRKKISDGLKSFMKEKGVSPETRKKLSISNMGHSVSKETREKISKAHTGRKVSKEGREKMRIANLGRKQSPENIAKRVLKNTGQKRSIEVRLKMSELKKGSKSPFWIVDNGRTLCEDCHRKTDTFARNYKLIK